MHVALAQTPLTNIPARTGDSGLVQRRARRPEARA